MNFLSHAVPYLHLGDPFLIAGTALPDWLSVIDRKIRARGRLAEAAIGSSGEAVRRVARGILHHHHDDHWFHGTRAFTELNLQFAIELREQMPGDEGFRPTFVGHILIEMILDGLWIEDEPSWGDEYYAMLSALDAAEFDRAVAEILGRPVPAIAEVVERFVAARFLYDYQQPAKLMFRLNQVMRRVRLVDLPPSIADWLPRAMSMVKTRRHELLTPDDAPSPFPIDFPGKASSR